MTKKCEPNVDCVDCDLDAVCVGCKLNEGLSADCIDCDLHSCACAECDLNPQACTDCVILFELTQKTVAEVLVTSLTDKPLILVYLDKDYDWPIQWTVKRETDTLISVDGWFDVGDGLFLPINDQSIDDNTMAEKDAVKRVDALFKMGAYVKVA